MNGRSALVWLVIVVGLLASLQLFESPAVRGVLMSFSALIMLRIWLWWVTTPWKSRREALQAFGNRQKMRRRNLAAFLALWLALVTGLTFVSGGALRSWLAFSLGGFAITGLFWLGLALLDRAHLPSKNPAKSPDPNSPGAQGTP
jgi:hypothetical protein